MLIDVFFITSTLVQTLVHKKICSYKTVYLLKNQLHVFQCSLGTQLKFISIKHHVYRLIQKSLEHI